MEAVFGEVELEIMVLDKEVRQRAQQMRLVGEMIERSKLGALNIELESNDRRRCHARTDDIAHVEARANVRVREKLGRP